MAWEEEQEGTAEVTIDEESGGKKKSLLKLIIFVVIALVVLGGVGFGVKVFFFSGEDTQVEETDGTETQNGEDGATVEGETTEDTEEEIVEGVIVGLEPFVVNLSDPEGRRYLKAKIRLEVDKQELLDDVSKPSSVLLYRTRDAILEILASKTVEEVLPVENRRDLRNEIKFRLNRIYDRSSIKAKVLEVYFTEFLID